MPPSRWEPPAGGGAAALRPPACLRPRSARRRPRPRVPAKQEAGAFPGPGVALRPDEDCTRFSREALVHLGPICGRLRAGPGERASDTETLARRPRVQGVAGWPRGRRLPGSRPARAPPSWGRQASGRGLEGQREAARESGSGRARRMAQRAAGEGPRVKPAERRDRESRFRAATRRSGLAVLGKVKTEWGSSSLKRRRGASSQMESWGDNVYPGEGGL